MKCPIQTDNAELLLAYCTRTLDGETAAILERHIDGCTQCLHFRDGQRAVWSALDHWEAMPASPDFDRRLYRRIEAEGQPGWWSRLFRQGGPVLLRPAFPLAAVCLLLVAGFLLEYPNLTNSPAGDASRASAVETLEADQVETTLDDVEMLRQFNLVPLKKEPSSQSI